MIVNVAHEIQGGETRDGLELKLIGSSGVVLDGRALELPIKKTFALLAYLALEGTTSRSRLAGLFWSQNDEEAARRNLRRELHRLREAGLRDRLETEGESLRLAGAVETDVHRLRAAAEGNPMERDLERALESAHGELLEGGRLEGASGFEEWLQRERERLVQTRHRLMLTLAERLETRGEWRRALELHLSLLGEDALQERTHREVMRLHYLLGEREAALIQFERCRTALATELGLEPLPETVRLAEEIRTAQAFSPASTSAQAEGEVGRSSAPLIGRERELGALGVRGAALRLLIGEPGVGKSRLAQEFARQFSTSLTLRFTEASKGTPLYAVAEAIRQGLSSERLTGLDPLWQREAARLAPELDPDASQTAPDGAQPEGRVRFLEGLSRALEALGDVWVLDDLHWADASSLELVAYLAQRSGARLVATARAQELETNEVASAALTALERGGFLERVPVAPLSEEDVLGLVRAMSGASGGTLFARRLARTTAGNPFFVLETIRHLFETGNLRIEADGGWSTPFDETTTDYAELPVPPSVIASIRDRTDRLGPAAQRLLETASLAGDGFHLEEVQPATALTDWEGLDGLEAAVRANVLERAGEGYRFAHDLVRSALERTLGPERRRLIHGKLALALEAQEAAPARIAHHLEHAGTPRLAVGWRVKAAEAAGRVFAYRDSLEHLDRAVENATDTREVFALRVRMLRLHEYIDQPRRWEEDLEAAEAIAESLDDDALRIEAALERVHLLIWQSRDAPALERAQWVLQQPDLTPLQHAWALEYAAHTLVNLGRLEESDAARQEVIDRLEGPPSVLRGRAMYGRMMNAYKRGDYAAAREWATRCHEEWQAVGAKVNLINVHTMEGVFASIAGDMDAAIRSLEIARDEASRVGHPTYQVAALFNLFEIHMERGSLPEAQAALEDVKHAKPVFNDPFEGAAFVRYESQAAWFSGNLGRAVALAQSAIELDEESNVMEHRLLGRLTVAGLYLEIGHGDPARVLLEEVDDLIRESSIGFFTFTLNLRRAHLDLCDGNPNGALERLEDLESSAPTARADEIARYGVLTALTRHRLGDAAGASAALEALPETLGLESRAQAAALRCTLDLALGRDIAPSLRTAEAMRTSGRVTALDALALERAVIAALEGTDADDLRREARERVLALVRSLETFPELRERFLEQHRDLTG